MATQAGLGQSKAGLGNNDYKKIGKVDGNESN